MFDSSSSVVVGRNPRQVLSEGLRFQRESETAALGYTPRYGADRKAGERGVVPGTNEQDVASFPYKSTAAGDESKLR